MRIVFLQDDFPPESRGGAGILVATLARALVREGHTVTVITATQERGNVGESVSSGIPVYRIYSDYRERWRGYRGLYNWQTISKVRRILAELKPDIVHAHNVHYHLSYHCLVLAKRYAKKVVFTAHDEMLFHYGKFYECIETGDYAVHWWQLARRFKRRWNPLRNFFIHWCLRSVPIVSLSAAHQAVLKANGFHSTVVYNGIDPEGWPASPDVVEDFKRTYGLVGKRVVLFAGRVSHLKGADAAQRALELVRQHVPGVVLLIAGGKGHMLHAVYTGWLDSEHMKAAYGASDVVVFPSIYFDPFGLVNLEAMASGKPVVATCFGGAPEIIVEGETGYIVDPRDTEHFAARIGELLLDSAKAVRMGEAGRARVFAKFTASRMAEEYLEVYTA